MLFFLYIDFNNVFFKEKKNGNYDPRFAMCCLCVCTLHTGAPSPPFVSALPPPASLAYQVEENKALSFLTTLATTLQDVVYLDKVDSAQGGGPGHPHSSLGVTHLCFSGCSRETPPTEHAPCPFEHPFGGPPYYLGS